MIREFQRSTDVHTPIGRFVEVNGCRLWVDAREGPGPCVIFLPGSGEIGLDLWHTYDRVTARRAGVIYDRGGTGGSARVPLPRAASVVAKELAGLLRALTVEGEVILVAHSLMTSFQAPWTGSSRTMPATLLG